MNQTKKTLEGLKEKQQLCIAMGCPQGQFLSTVIGWGEALEKAEGELEEKDVGGECSDPLHCNICEFKKGSDEMRSIAIPILAKAKLRIEDLEKDNLFLSNQAKYADERNDYSYKQLQSANKKIEELEKTIDSLVKDKFTKYGNGYGFLATDVKGQKVWVNAVSIAVEQAEEETKRVKLRIEELEKEVRRLQK